MPFNSESTCDGEVTALILAGGAGTRMGGADKGLADWHGKTLVQQVHECIGTQVDRVLISCNRNRQRYALIAELAPPDLRAGFQGPLAGLEAAIPAVHSPLLLLVPCDSPLLPADLVTRLRQALGKVPDSNVAYATSAGDNFYLCALLRTSCLQALPDFLDTGGRAVRQWYQSIGAVEVNFDDEAGNFLNLNHAGRP